ncbi:cytidine deaminase [Ruminococcaceae bacterium OttesenSCG-928-A16]|nr:cytidine deaminase [Ruminococcaceae bacterium OttesenSCG-928-A16]
MDFDARALAAAAVAARSNSYSPYSGFAVGAALLCANGAVYTGCNVENAAYSVTNCAERTALFAAVNAGQRTFVALAVAGGPAAQQPPLPACPPCGVCRQALYEFTGPGLPVVLAQTETDYTITTLGALLPQGFGPANLSE